MSRQRKRNPTAAQTTASLFAQAPPEIAHNMRRDEWIADKLGNPKLYAVGITTQERRIELQRAEILRQGIADERLSLQETWAQAFERWHGQTLQPDLRDSLPW